MLLISSQIALLSSILPVPPLKIGTQTLLQLHHSWSGTTLNPMLPDPCETSLQNLSHTAGSCLRGNVAVPAAQQAGPLNRQHQQRSTGKAGTGSSSRGRRAGHPALAEAAARWVVCVQGHECVCVFWGGGSRTCTDTATHRTMP